LLSPRAAWRIGISAPSAHAVVVTQNFGAGGCFAGGFCAIPTDDVTTTIVESTLRCVIFMSISLHA
jgi:hypothetical protein